MEMPDFNPAEAPAVDRAKIERIRRAVEGGEYHVDAAAVAEKLVAKGFPAQLTD